MELSHHIINKYRYYNIKIAIVQKNLKHLNGNLLFLQISNKVISNNYNITSEV